MELTTTEKIRLALGRKNMTVQDLADKIGTTRQNLHNKLVRGNFKEEDLKQIAEAMNGKIRVTFVFDDDEI